MSNQQTSTPQVAIIVVTYNSADLLPRFFAALAQTRYSPYEVLVVDNNSADKTTNHVRSGRYGPLQLLACGENNGFGRACNRGAAAVRGDLLVFMNPDVVVTPHWLERLVASSARNPDALLCPTTLYPGETPRPLDSMHAVAAIPGAALLVPRTVWNELGGFDEQFFMYWEDAEFCWRAWLLGFRVLADLSAYVYHDRGGSAGDQQWDAERTKNSLRTYVKLMRWRVVVPFALVLALKTLVKWWRKPDPALFAAWGWNIKQLGLTLAERRAILARRRGDPALLEQRIAELDWRLRAARRQRSRR